MSGLGNTKNNFFARLMGKTSRDKSVYPQQEVPYNPTPQGGVPQSGFVPQYLPNYVGQPQGAPTQPAVMAGSQPTQPSLPQPQAGQPTDQQSGTAGAPNSRYRLMQMIEPKPERDQEGMGVLQRRAKINAIGQGFSALAGLGGIAMGGDAPAQADIVTPFNMQQIQVMDADYRNRLQDWVNRSFQVEAANNQTLNREVDQTIDAENAMERVKLQGENARQLAEQRAQAALQQLQAKSQAEQMQAMEAMGINPNDPQAYEKYLNAQRQKFTTDMNYTKARTNWNNRTPGGSGSTKTPFPYSLETVKKGRDAKISELNAQREAAVNAARTMPEKQAAAERFDKMIDYYRKYNPGSNELMDMEMAELGFQLEEQGAGGAAPTGGASAGNKGGLPRFDPQRGFVNTPRKNDPVIRAEADKTLSSVIPLIEKGDFSRSKEALQAIIDLGLADSEESAGEVLYDLLYSEEDQQDQ
jgi:hypothetical protein